jgi:hypothetical protein
MREKETKTFFKKPSFSLGMEYDRKSSLYFTADLLSKFLKLKVFYMQMLKPQVPYIQNTGPHLFIFVLYAVNDYPPTVVVDSSICISS